MTDPIAQALRAARGSLTEIGAGLQEVTATARQAALGAEQALAQFERNCRILAYEATRQAEVRAARDARAQVDRAIDTPKTRTNKR